MAGEPVDVWSMADLATPFAVRTVATLRVADVLAYGPLPLKELAQRCGASPEPLGRVLRFLTCRGVFTEQEPGVFAANDASRALEDDAGEREWLDLDSPAGRADLAFVELINQVRAKHTSYPAAFGRTFREDLATEEDLAESFDRLRERREIAPAVARSYDWSKFQRIADVGGGTGVLLAEILREHQTLHGVLVDLPAPAHSAENYLRERGMAERAEILTANYFEELPLQVDACVLCDVLGDWDDEEAVWILTHCIDAVGADGRVLIVESTPHQPEELTSFTELDLRMLVYVGGHMRDLEGTKRIAEAAGLAVTGATQIDDHCMIECLRAL
jgi:hypothetical protein